MPSVPKRTGKKSKGKLKPKRVRDYQAEYQRRLDLAQQRGQTRAQGRRGAKKYAEAPPREHVRRAQVTAERYQATPREVTRQRLAARQVRRGGADHLVQTFHILDRAMDFAATLGEDVNIYILGHGKFRYSSSRYEVDTRGWAAITDFNHAHRFANPANRARWHAKDADLFNPKATTYQVRTVGR